jgi:ubiquinone/menaquinone biosynthesis C-methylase UbiE
MEKSVNLKAMQSKQVFSTKAEKYARYRWDYTPAAIQAIFDTAGLSSNSVVADIGAGTGILTRHFSGKVHQAYAIEPNREMRLEAEKALVKEPGCIVLDASAEETGLADHSVDLIAVATAIHWFDPEPTRAEFLRILKPGGWLAIIHNHGTEDEMGQALEKIFIPEYGVRPAESSGHNKRKPVDFYYGSSTYRQFVFPFSFQQGWEGFFGSLCSTSYMPDESHPCYPSFEKAVRAVFDQYCPNGIMSVCGNTQVCIGNII